MTATSSFGTGRRESHNATGFYSRFTAPTETKVKLADLPPDPHLPDPLLVAGDARHMTAVPDSTVALVVTSPPYFAGKDYETSPGDRESGGDGSPATWVDYLGMLDAVFAECLRIVEPGGRIAVNVANLGRRPYRSLSAAVTHILEDQGWLVRAEHIWQKADAASGSCTFGSWMSPSNPAVRDLTERVIVASKGQFGRAGTKAERARAGRPHQATITRDEFLAWTYDLWRIRPESARRVGHPAPFPVELPERIIKLHTYAGELVVDPFCGSGSTGVAAARTGRLFVGYDLDPGYLALAAARIAAG